MMKLSTGYHMWNITAAWWVPNRFWNSKTNKTPVIWQDSRIRCNACRDLQSRGVLQLQRNWQSYFTLCGEKKPSLKNSRMQQLSTYSKGKGILKSVTIIDASLYCDKHRCISLLSIAGKSPTESIKWTPWTVRASTRKPVWIQERQRNNRHDLHSKTASREMPGTECGPLHDLLSTLPKHLTQSVVRDFETLWQSLVDLPNS